MAIFEWICRECLIYWDRDCAIGKAPKRTKCPKCKKLCGKYWENANTSISFKDDGCGNANGTGGAMDFHTIKQRYRKHAKKGYDKDSANRFLHSQIKKTQERTDDDSFRYKSANFKWDKMAEDGVVRKLGTAEAYQKKKRAEKLTSDAYHIANKMGHKDINQDKLDITKPQKQG